MVADTIEAPVLLVTYNRPDYTEKVIEAILAANIKKLYVFNDGPKPDRPEDEKKCLMIREMINRLESCIEIETKFSDKNLGCGNGVSSAISWAFSKEDRLIILEDDCVPSPQFFPYCEKLLERYKDDCRVWAICGENHKFTPEAFTNGDYIFTQFGFCAGWATWKRCWDHFDLRLSSLKYVLDNRVFEDCLFDERIGRQFSNFFSKAIIDQNRPGYWSLQFWYQVLINRGYYVVPRELLIKNIGIEGDHTDSENEYLNKESSQSFKVVNYPSFVLANKVIEKAHYQARVRYILGDVPFTFRLKKAWIKSTKVFRTPNI